MPKKSMADRIDALERLVAELRVRAVEASEFRLVDKHGKLRAVLEITRHGPRLALLDDAGTVAAEFTLTRDGPGLRFADLDGQTRAWLGVTKDAARMALADRDANQRLFVGVMPSGPCVKMYDDKQRLVWDAEGRASRAQGKPRD